MVYLFFDWSRKNGGKEMIQSDHNCHRDAILVRNSFTQFHQIPIRFDETAYKDCEQGLRLYDNYGLIGSFPYRHFSTPIKKVIHQVIILNGL